MKEKKNRPKNPKVENLSIPEDKFQDKVEQRAQFLAENENRSATEDDRAGAEKELLAPNEPIEGSEITSELGNKESFNWNEPATDNGHQTPKVLPDDFRNPSKELVEKGLRRPNQSRNGRDE